MVYFLERILLAVLLMSRRLCLSFLSLSSKILGSNNGRHLILRVNLKYSIGSGSSSDLVCIIYRSKNYNMNTIVQFENLLE